MTFLAQICPKRKLEFEIQKTNVGIKISIFEIPCAPIFKQNEQLWPFGSKFAQKWILGSKFGISLDSESASLRYYVYQFTYIRDKFEFLGPNLPKNGFLGRKFKNLSLDLESASLRHHVYQFLDKTNNKFLCPNLPKNEFWGRNFKILSLDLESTPPIYHVCQFSVKMDNF